MAKTDRTTKETIANLGFEAELGNISIFGQERNVTTHHLTSQGMIVLVFANSSALPGSEVKAPREALRQRRGRAAG